MGVCVNNIDRSIVTDTSRLPNISGVTVLRVRRGAPAEQAGIQVGDIILEINDIPINYTTQFLEVLYRYASGDGIKVAYITMSAKQHKRQP